MHHPTDRITHTTAFVTPVVEHWLEREIAQWVHPMKDRSTEIVADTKREMKLCGRTSDHDVMGRRIDPSWYGQVRSGQVRSVCLMCTFRASCYSTHLSWAHTPIYS